VTVSGSSLPNGTPISLPVSFTIFDFATDIDVTDGDELAFVLTATTAGIYPYAAWIDADSNPYGGGTRVWKSTTGSWAADSSTDLGFKVYVDTAVVPLPASAWLGLGLLSAMGLVRRIRRRKTA